MPATGIAQDIWQQAARTDAEGVASFTLSDGSPFQIQFLDQDTKSAVPGAIAYLFIDSSGVALAMLSDPTGRYFTQMARVALPGAAASVRADGDRRVQVGLASVPVNPASAVPRLSIETAARTAGVAAAAALEHHAARVVAAGVDAEVILSRDVAFRDIPTIMNLGSYASSRGDDVVGGIFSGLDMCDDLQTPAGSALARGASLYKWVDRIKGAGGLLAVQENLLGILQAGYECAGYAPDQMFRVTVVRGIRGPVHPLLKRFTKIDVWAAPLEEPARPSCLYLLGLSQGGGVAGQVIDAVSKRRITRRLTVTGGGPGGFVVFSSDGTFNRDRVLPPGRYSVTAEAEGYAANTVLLQIRSGDVGGLTIELTPIATARVVISPGAPSPISEGTGNVRFGAAAYTSAGTLVNPQPTFRWISQNEAAATIGMFDGLARGVRAGPTRITASAEGVTSAPVPLLVEKPENRLAGNPSSLPFRATRNGSNPGAQSINLTSTAPGLAWHASVSPATSWMTLGATSGTTPQALAVSISIAGLSAGTYTSTIVITGPDSANGSVSVAVTLTVAEACSFTLSRTAATVAAAGESGSVTVTTASGCAWTAASQASFLSITGGASGTATGSVTFQASANTGASRSGTLLVAGQTVTVMQNAGTTSNPGAGVSVTLTGCDRSAGDLPEWINCRGYVDVTVSRVNQSGYVSAFFAYPDSGSFYHGDVRVTAGQAPGRIRITVLNNYVPRCPASGYRSTLSLRDGPQSASSAPVIAQEPLTFRNCS